MPTDKQLADMLFELAQELFTSGCVMRALLAESGLANWRGRLDKTLNSEQATHLREEFRELYEQCLARADQKALGDFLEQVKVSGRIQ